MSSPTVAVKKARSNGRQDHPKGLLETVDDPLKRRIRDQLDKKGWDQRSLAAKLSVSPASITNMFKPGPRQIRFLPQLIELLEIEDYRKTVIDAFAKMSPEEQANFVGVLKSVVAKR